MKKSIIVIILIVVLYLLLAIYGFDYIDSIFHKNIYIGDTRWEYSKGKWIDSSNKISNGLKLSNYYIYKQNTWEYVGRYDMKYTNNNWYMRSRNGYIKYDYPLFAYKGSGIKLYSFDVKYNVEKTKVNAILKKANISKYSALNLSKSVKIDIDNDGADEVIYVLSNVYSQNEEPILFSIVALEDNGEYKIIPSIEVESIDSTGAGDIYHGAFTYFLANKYSFENCLRLANIAGALSVSKVGSKASIPKLEEVLKYHEL